MARPRRQHPRLGIALESPQARDFLELCLSVVGQTELEYEALESFKDGTHLFAFPGESGLGLLVERRERDEGEERIHQLGFLAAPAGEDVLVQIELVAHRWDPKLSATVTGDESVKNASRAKRRAITAERAARSGRLKDVLTMQVLPIAAAPPTVAGFERATVDQALAKHQRTLGETVEPSAQPSSPASSPVRARPPDGGGWPSGDIYLGPGFPAPEPIHTPASAYLGKERMVGQKAYRYLAFLEQEGFRAGFDDDGDVWFEFEGGHYYLVSEEDDAAYFRLLFPSFWPVTDEGTRRVACEAISRVNREVKGVKLLIAGDQVDAELELFLEPFDSFTRVFPRCLVAVRAAVERFWELVTPQE